jgi:hypothetical protein
MFSRFSVYLKANNAYCRTDLANGFKKSYKPSPDTFHIRQVANIHGFYDNNHYLNNMHYHTIPLHFRITLNRKEPSIYTKLKSTQSAWSDYDLLYHLSTSEQRSVAAGVMTVASPSSSISGYGSNNVVVNDLNASGFRLFKDSNPPPLFFSGVPPNSKKPLMEKYISEMTKGLESCQDRIPTQDYIEYI